MLISSQLVSAIVSSLFNIVDRQIYVSSFSCIIFKREIIEMFQCTSPMLFLFFLYVFCLCLSINTTFKTLGNLYVNYI